MCRASSVKSQSGGVTQRSSPSLVPSVGGFILTRTLSLDLSRNEHLEYLEQQLLQMGSCSAWLVPGTQKLHLCPSAFCGQVSSPFVLSNVEQVTPR